MVLLFPKQPFVSLKKIKAILPDVCRNIHIYRKSWKGGSDDYFFDYF